MCKNDSWRQMVTWININRKLHVTNQKRYKLQCNAFNQAHLSVFNPSVHNFKPLESEFICALTNHVLEHTIFIGCKSLHSKLIDLYSTTNIEHLISTQCRHFQWTLAIHAFNNIGFHINCFLLSQGWNLFQICNGVDSQLSRCWCHNNV